jgi:hypothetical protein
LLRSEDPWFWLPAASVAASWVDFGTDLGMLFLKCMAEFGRGMVITDHPGQVIGFIAWEAKRF